MIRPQAFGFDGTHNFDGSLISEVGERKRGSLDTNITSPGFSNNNFLGGMARDMRARPPFQDMMFRGQATGFDGNPIRNFGPQRGIGSFPNPFGNRGGFGNPYGGSRGGFGQPPQFGGGMYGNPYGGGFGMQRPPMFGSGYGMQQPGFGGGFGGNNPFGPRPPLMYGGGFSGPPMFGGGYMGMPPMFGGGNPFGPGFGGGIGGMFPGMRGGFGYGRPPMYGGGFGGGFNRPMPQPIRPLPQPIKPMPKPVRPIAKPSPEPMPIQRPRPIKPIIGRPMPINRAVPKTPSIGGVGGINGGGKPMPINVPGGGGINYGPDSFTPLQPPADNPFARTRVNPIQELRSPVGPKPISSPGFSGNLNIPGGGGIDYGPGMGGGLIPPQDFGFGPGIRPVLKRGLGSFKNQIDIARLPGQSLRAMPFQNNIITKGRDGMMIY